MIRGGFWRRLIYRRSKPMLRSRSGGEGGQATVTTWISHHSDIARAA